MPAITEHTPTPDKPKRRRGHPRVPRILRDNPAAASEFWELQDRNGNSIWIPRTVYAELTRFDEKGSTGALVLWHNPDAQGFDEDHVLRAVTAGLERRGKRHRVTVEKHPSLDAYVIRKGKGVRTMPTAVLKELKAIAELTKTAVSAEDAAEIIARRDRLERMNAGLLPVQYARRGATRSVTSKYEWESLIPGEVRIFDATPRQLRGSFQRWAEARDVLNARVKTVVLADGRTAATVNGLAGETCGLHHWRDLSVRPMYPMTDEDYAALFTNVNA
jgi:hypothetical protein